MFNSYFYELVKGSATFQFWAVTRPTHEVSLFFLEDFI